MFWRSEVYPNIVTARVRHSSTSQHGTVLCLADARCHRTLLKTYDGSQYVLLRSPNGAVQLRCDGNDVRIVPFSLELIVDGFPDVESSQRRIKQLADIYRNRPLRRENHEWTVEAQRHRDALVAYDLKLLGCKYRDIADFIYGSDYVAEEWTNPNRTLKNRTVRAVKRGIHFVEKGYFSLLR